MKKRPRIPGAVGRKWADLLRALPLYDPFRAPGDAWFDAAEAEAAITFIEECVRHVEGALAGQPFLLQPWQKSLVANLFGWKREDRKGRVVRRYREAFIYVPRKNGKTPLSAALALYVFFCDDEPGQQGYVAAADREQAGMLFRQAKGMVELEPELSSRCRVYGGAAQGGQSRSIVREADASFLRVISADADSKHGGNSHLVIIDELHAQPSRDLVDVLQTSMASANRKQPLLVLITTADFDRPSICNEKHDYACKARDGVIDDPTFLPVVYEADREADWASPEVWAAANPNLGVSVSEEYLERECAKAKESPAYQNTFRRLHLNQKTETDTRAIDMAKWDACAALPLDEADLAGRECYGGLDLSTTTDLSAWAKLFPPSNEGEPWKLLMRFWAPRERARQRSQRDRVPYEAWAQQGWLKLTAGDVIDYDVIRADVNADRQKFNVREIAADRWNATQILTQLAGDGFEVIAFGQGYQSMTAPTKELLALVQSARLAPGANPVLRWMASVFSVEQDAAGNLKPSKKKSTDRIDGVVALLMALGRAMLKPSPASVYDGRGVLMLGADAEAKPAPAGAAPPVEWGGDWGDDD